MYVSPSALEERSYIRYGSHTDLPMNGFIVLEGSIETDVCFLRPRTMWNKRGDTRQHRAVIETLFAIGQRATDIAMDPGRHQTVELAATVRGFAATGGSFPSSSPSGSMAGDEIGGKRLVASLRRRSWCRWARSKLSRVFLLSLLQNI